MIRFSPQELEAIDRLWRAVPPDHVWTGWSACGDEPEEVWIYRTRAHWRKLPLRKLEKAFVLFDEKDRKVAEAPSLAELLAKVEAIPGLVTE